MNRLSRIFRPFHLPSPKNKLKIFKEKDTLSKGYKLLLNYGIIHQSSTGMYHVLPMGQRVLDKLTKIADNHMKLIGAQKMTLPFLTKQHLWEQSETYEKSKDELFHLKDRAGEDFILSPTHEQSISNLLSEEMMSYRDFPQLLYQITPKFRDEHRSKLGLLRSKEFLMKDLYSFDINEEKAEKTYNKVTNAYEKIFELLGIKFHKVSSGTEPGGEKGIRKAHEYFYLSDVGDDKLYVCNKCEEVVPASVYDNRNTCLGCSYYIQKENFVQGVEIGHTFSFGTYFSERLGSCYVDINCQRTPLHMCSYGIGISRLLSASVEMLSTDEELRWPLALAPYSVCIIPPKAGSKEETEVELLLPEIYQLFEGISVLNNDTIIDDRTEKTIGKRLMEANSFGFPFIVIAGKDATQRVPLLELHDVINKKKFLMPPSSLVQYLYDKTKFLTEEKPKISYITMV